MVCKAKSAALEPKWPGLARCIDEFVMMARRTGTFGIWIVLAAIAFFAFVAMLVALAPLFFCPSCIDLEIAVFGCDICGGIGGPKNARNISLLKRWQSIRALEREGNRKLLLFR